MGLNAYSMVDKSLKSLKFWSNNYLILREFKHFPKLVVLALVFTFLGAISEGLGIGVLVSFLQNLTTPNAPPIQTGINWFDVWILGIHASATNRLYRISALILGVTWMRVGFTYLAYVYTEMAQYSLLDRLRKQIFEQLQAFSLSYFSKTRSGELINTITTEIERLRQAFGGFSFLLTTSLTALVYVISLFCLSWQLTIIAVMLFALLTVGLSNLNRRVREASFGVTKASGQFTSTAMEFISGIRTVQTFATQDFERRRFYRASANIVKAATKSVLAWALVQPLAEGLATTVLVSMIGVAFTVFVTSGKLQVASLLTFFFVLFRLVPLLQAVNNVRAQLNTLVGSADNIQALLRQEDKPYFHNGRREFSGLKQSIEFVAVDFGYDASQLVLHNITLTLERGQMTALVGASGAGKTTLADLIARFYDPIQGEILIDGTDLREFEIGSLRRKMAVVSQDTFIFNTSVRENIAYGTEGATEAEIIEAARLANAMEFIEQMPEGLETLLGDRGVRLSGGQRQRIAIARALLRNPEILILDEATSALDSVSERLIQESLEKLAVGRTVIAIAHRLSTIIRADKVVVLDGGQIVEQGRYQELLEHRGSLWKYHQMQYELGQVS
jgi:subfamily B ATP-binding cassette protein MsbA